MYKSTNYTNNVYHKNIISQSHSFPPFHSSLKFKNGKKHVSSVMSKIINTKGHMNSIIKILFSIQPSPQEPEYKIFATRAFAYKQGNVCSFLDEHTCGDNFFICCTLDISDDQLFTCEIFFANETQNYHIIIYLQLY